MSLTLDATYYGYKYCTCDEGKYGTPPTIEYLHSPVMVDNGAGTISVAA